MEGFGRPIRGQHGHTVGFEPPLLTRVCVPEFGGQRKEENEQSTDSTNEKSRYLVMRYRLLTAPLGAPSCVWKALGSGHPTTEHLDRGLHCNLVRYVQIQGLHILVSQLQ